MNFKNSTAILWVIAFFMAALLISSCEKDLNSPTDEILSSNKISPNNLKKGKGKGKASDPEPDPGEDPFIRTYQLFEAIDGDPLYKFSISQSDQLIWLETDPTITSWGATYWGYWSDPFVYSNHEVNYIIGLTHTTYRFQELPGNKFDVTKTLVVQPYPSGSPTTTDTHPGIYILVN
ncbi:MAG: hypothetical protein JSW33_00875 [bacterium]|nr:MAG: hypothetical protein JSW33_00875 [bacterium]